MISVVELVDSMFGWCWPLSTILPGTPLNFHWLQLEYFRLEVVKIGVLIDSEWIAFLPTEQRYFFLKVDLLEHKITKNCILNDKWCSRIRCQPTINLFCVLEILSIISQMEWFVFKTTEDHLSRVTHRPKCRLNRRNKNKNLKNQNFQMKKF